MFDSGPIDWDVIPESGRAALVELASMMEGRFTGEVHLQLNEGGVRSWSEGRKKSPKDLGRNGLTQ